MTNPDEAAARALRTRLADLGPRLGSAAVLIAVATLSWWVGSIAFFIVWLIAALVVHFEWQRIVGGANLDARLAIGTLSLIAAADRYSLAGVGVRCPHHHRRGDRQRFPGRPRAAPMVGAWGRLRGRADLPC